MELKKDCGDWESLQRRPVPGAYPSPHSAGNLGGALEVSV